MCGVGVKPIYYLKHTTQSSIWELPCVSSRYAILQSSAWDALHP